MGKISGFTKFSRKPKTVKMQKKVTLEAGTTITKYCYKRGEFCVFKGAPTELGGMIKFVIFGHLIKCYIRIYLTRLNILFLMFVKRHKEFNGKDPHT